MLTSFSKELLARIARYLSSECTVKNGERILTTLSGGCDSVSLMLILKQLGYHVEAIHCNFHLRGEESDRDENFCRELCKKNDIPFHLVHFDTSYYAHQHKQSIELAARNLRYSYFEQLRKDINASVISVAHHKEDQAETILLNLIRGTGLRGLTGMKARNGRIVRPLLCTTRNELELYLKELNVSYVNDSSNFEREATRNKIRLDVIPLLQTINPSVINTLVNMSRQMSDYERVLDISLNHSINNVFQQGSPSRIQLEKLQRQPSPQLVLFHILKKYGFSPEQIQQIAHHLDAPTGKIFSSSTHQLLFDRGQLLINPIFQPLQHEISIPEPGTYLFNDSRLRLEIKDVKGDFHINANPNEAFLNNDKIAWPIRMRYFKNGDKFSPLGMKGYRLVSDFLTDRKKNIFEKQSQLVVVDKNNRILWLVGERIENRLRIESSTQQALHISYFK